MKYLVRILALPFVYAIFIIAVSYRFIRDFVLYGGEFNVYQKDTQKRISDVFKKLEDDSKV